MSEKKIVIFFSGNGSNMENIIKTLQNKIYVDKFGKEYIIKIPFVICNKRDAYGITRAKNLNIECKIINKKLSEFEVESSALLDFIACDLVVLAGFMRILSPEFCKKYKALNIHPSILPLFKGANGILDSFYSNMKIAGVSVHFVSEQLDSGEIIAQDIIYKIDGESLEDFERRIHELEYKIYPKAILEVLGCKK